MRYIGWDTSGWPRSKSGNSIAGLYTRLEIYSNADRGGGNSNSGDGEKNPIALRSYDKENRSWVERLLASETDTVTTLANIEIKDPELKVAVPLFSISHASGRDLGNTWVTNYTQSYVESPLFLIGSNTAMVVHLNAQVSKDLKSQAAASIIGAVTQAVQIAAPTSTLLTTLSKPEINNAASAIDTTISNMFSNDKSEDVELGRFADSWAPGDQLVVTGCAPFVRLDGTRDERCSSLQDASSMDIKVGQWTIGMRCPQISVFDSRDICTTASNQHLMTASEIDTAQSQIATSVRNSDILKFPLSSQVSIMAFAQTQDWYTNFLKSQKTDSDAASFCASAMGGTSSFVANGLSVFDSALALRAIIETASGVVQSLTVFEKSKSCLAVLAQAPAVKLPAPPA